MRATYRAAAHVVALSPGMRDGVIAAGVRPDRVTLIPNASDLELFSPHVDPGDLRARLGLEGAFVASYFGTMGEANDLGQVVEAAALLQGRGERSVAFVLQGDGKRRRGLEADIEGRGLDNVQLLPAGDKHSAARLAAASDAVSYTHLTLPTICSV